MKQSNWLLKNIISIFSCVLIITLGVAILVRAVPITTMIGENMATNNLDVTGIATVTGNITATGTIESTGGGIKFPDGTIQTTEGITQVGTLTPEYMYPEDLGKNWKNEGYVTDLDWWSGMNVGSSSSVYIGNGIVLFGTNTGHIFRSIDNGATWTDLGQITQEYCYILYLGNGIVVAEAGSDVYRSTDFGLTWTDIATLGMNGLSSLEYLGNGIVLIGGNESFNDGKIFRSIDYGLTWSLVATFTDSIYGNVQTISYLENGRVIAGVGRSAYRSTDYGLTWDSLEMPWNIVEIPDPDQRIFYSSEYLGSGITLLGASLGYIFRSTDYGATWTNLGSFSSTDVNTLAYLGNGVVLFGNCNAEIIRSMDYGLTWPTNLGIIASSGNIVHISYLGNGIVIAGGGSGEILRSDVPFSF